MSYLANETDCSQEWYSERSEEAQAFDWIYKYNMKYGSLDYGPM